MSMPRSTRLLLSLLTAALWSCASTPRPQGMKDAASTRRAPAVEQAKRLAPQAHARAELFYDKAQKAFDDGDLAGSQILSEQALAAYGRAVIQARLVQAETRRAESQARLLEAEKLLQTLDEQHKRALVEAEALELRAKVLRDALPLPASAPASPERERARLDAARSLTSQAKLLCLAARLLAPERERIASGLTKVDALEQRLLTKPAPVPIDEASQLRSECLSELTLARRPEAQKNPAFGGADRLLSELSNGDWLPFRDDRGVVVTLRGVFAGDKFEPHAEERLAELGRIAKAHPEFPVLVVLHTARADAKGVGPKRAARVADALRVAGAARVEAQAVGSTQPVLPPSRAGAAERNERVEIVFVAPAS
jgi:outer membrane protein OmpA-like peptidoglycan-associated protein